VFLKILHKINTIEILNGDDLANGLHISFGEPYFYDFGYKSSEPTVINCDNRCLMTQPRDPTCRSDECVLYSIAIPTTGSTLCFIFIRAFQKLNDGHPKYSGTHG